MLQNSCRTCMGEKTLSVKKWVTACQNDRWHFMTSFPLWEYLSFISLTFLAWNFTAWDRAASLKVQLLPSCCDLKATPGIWIVASAQLLISLATPSGADPRQSQSFFDLRAGPHYRESDASFRGVCKPYPMTWVSRSDRHWPASDMGWISCRMFSSVQNVAVQVEVCSLFVLD